MAASSAGKIPDPDTDEEPLSSGELAELRALLEAKRVALVKAAQESLEQDMMLDTNEMPDEVDLASTEYIQSFALRLRGRERHFLDKIDVAIQKIEDGVFGTCEECEEEIGRKRLAARPETTLCIRCKEDQEREERDFR
ncbi:MAG: TraR/DksA C4-type zinc finger protein [Sandaracinaceae bacterium]|nr:TraR/DksA C4-type zinc finger protein [Sandaracinaceae bacterium]